MRGIGRQLLLGAAAALVLFLVAGCVWAIDWSMEHLEGTRHTNPLHGLLYHVAASWFAALVFLLLLRRPARVILPLRVFLGSILVQVGMRGDRSVAVGIGTAVVLHSLLCLAWRPAARGKGRRSAPPPPVPPWRWIAYLAALLVLQGILLAPASLPAERPAMFLILMGASGLVVGVLGALAWFPDPKRDRLLSSPRALFRRRGAARLLLLRGVQVAAGMLVLAFSGWWWQNRDRAVPVEWGDLRSWTLFLAAAAVGIALGIPLVRRLHPGRTGSRRHRKPRIRPLVVNTPVLEDRPK